MELLIMYLFTFITSISVEIANELRIFKDVTDAGYKIDFEKLSEFMKKVNPETQKKFLNCF